MEGQKTNIFISLNIFKAMICFHIFKNNYTIIDGKKIE